MTENQADSEQFEALSRELLRTGLTVRFQARGASMSPCICDGEIVHITPVITSKLRKDDIVLAKADERFLIHRLVVADPAHDFFVTRGDCGMQDDPSVRGDQILGLAVAKEIALGNKIVRTKLTGIHGKTWRSLACVKSAAGRLLRKAGLRKPVPGSTLLAVLFVLFSTVHSRGQVVVDTNPSTSASADLVGSGTQTLSFTHTTSATANRVLLVGVSMNIANAPTTGVVGITYNGAALNFVGAQNDSSNTRRVEQWYLLNPASGTNLPIIVSVNIPAAATVGVVAGATVLTDADQTVPLGTFVSASGESTGCIASTAAGNSQCNSALDAPSVVNGMVFDTLSVGLGTIAINGPQASQWNLASGGTSPIATQDLNGSASTRAGAPSVPLAENFNEVLTLTSATARAIGVNLSSVTPSTTTFTLTKVANAGGGRTVYTGTITGGGGNAYVGATVVVAGFTNANDNGTFTCTASNTTTLTLNNANGVAQTHAATATVTTSATYSGTITGGAGNAYNGLNATISGFTNAGNNGTFAITASSATSITVSNVASVAETNTGTAVIPTGTSTLYTGTITGGLNNGFAGDSFVIAGFSTASNNGTFTCTASTPTTLTCNNTAGATQTHAGTATTNATFNWVQGAISVNPSTADIGVTTSVASAVFTGQNTTYTTTIFNNGPSPANGASVTITWPSSMTVVSITPSSGTTCTAAPPPITCTPPTPFTTAMTATIAVTVTTTTAGSYPSTATVTDSGTPPDPNTGNNTYTAVATIQAIACGTVSQATAGTNLTGTLNTYYPGTASVAAGSTLIPIGTPTGAGTAIAKGNLLLVIQMQDAGINDTNSVLYGNGSTGQGFTALNSAGNYEFVTATGAISSGSVPISGAGLGGGLVFSYDESAATATAGQSTYQVIIVPQYTTASFNAATPPTALPWNGSTGGVLALDTSAALTLNGATVSVSGLGFRGAAGLQLSGGAGAATDFLHSSPATYTGASEAGVDGSKGEGIAGTPMWVQSGTTYLQTNTTEGYPNPAGGDGSMARGAPGNAGGGGTDPDPAANDQNAGGGGGGNGGAGGFGGDSWSTNQSTGGEGGVSFPATINRVVMGGGGGAGGRNNSDGDSQASSAAPGGGIIIIRTYALSGTATFTANGNNAYNGTANDAGGGGGAGGTIVVLSANGGESGLTLQANGGTGGNAWASQPFTWGNRHGPGGGGGGGVVLISGAPASASVAGGANGLTENPGVAYGSTPGTAGFSVTNETLTQTSGILSGAQCTPDMTLGKSHVGNFTRGLPAAYTIPVSNISPYGSTSAIVTVNDTLPTGLAPLSATGTGWACSIVSQTISCTDPTVLPGNSSYPSISVTANVLQTAPATVTNTAVVAGGGEINLSNDTATDVATVVSSADLSVTNAATPDPVAPGAAITYTQVLTNNGPSAADNATFVEAIPANTVFNTFSAPANWTCSLPPSGSTGNIVCTELNLPGSTAATFTLSVFVSPGAAKGTVIADTATASSSTADPNTANNSATAYTVVGSTATGELTVSNSASPNPVLVNNNITYTQVVTNTGSAAATGASFTEATPANTTFVSISAAAGWTCSSPPVSCTNPSVAAGSSGTFSVVYSVNSGTASGTTITDTATVNASNQAFGANSATATDVVATSGQADLALSTAATPTSVYAGNDITYTQTVSNNGPSAASSVSFTEAVPANTTFASISIPVGWLCTTPAVGAAGNVNCTDTSLASGTSADIIVVVNVAPSITVASITAASSVTASTIDPNSANNSTSVVTPVTEVCDLAVTNNGTPSPVQAGNNIVYTQVVTNNGPSNCAGASLTEAFPNNTTFVSFPAPAGWTCTTTGSISCSDPSFAPNTTSTFTLTVTVPNGTTAGTIIADTVTVSSTTHDINTTNNTATVAIGVASNTQADMSITDSGSPNPVNAGQNVTFTQTVANAGPATATTVKVTETLPTSTTFVSLTGPAGWSCTNTAPYTCSNPSMNSATNATISFVVAVASTVASGSPIADTASVSSVTGDPNLNNNTAASTVYVADSADLSVTNAASPVPVTAGSNITYTQVVNNAGPSTATSSTLTESTPPNTTFQSITIPSGWSCTTPAVGSAGTINCSNPSFAAGSSSFTVVVKVAAGTAAGTAVNDTVTVASSVSDPNTANNTATANDVVATGSQADLVTTNSALPASVAAGSNVTYSQSVTNLGPAVASSPVTLTEPTPPNTNFQSITPPTGWTCTTPAVGAAGTITCTDGSTLALNAPANFTLALQVNPGTPSGTTIAETATANAGNIVPNLTTNSATATVIVANANSADMAIVKTATPNGTVVEGDTLTYTLSVTNNGPATATNVTVVDPLPSAVTYLQANSTAGSCSEAGGTVTCLLGTMNNGATATVTVLTLATASGMATNTATVSADQVDPNLGNNTSTQTETITLPTSIKLQSFMAHLASSNGASGVVLQWKTGGESHNLGFNVYREQQGERVQLNSSLIAGSALLMAGAMPKHAAKTYAWIDNSPNPGSEPYWLEDVDVSGARTMHGPVTAGAAASDSSVPAPALMVPQLNQRQATSALGGHMAESVRHDFQPTPAQRQKQFEIAANPAVKILVEHEGWHRVTQPELLQVGLDPNVDPALLHLYAEAMEQPIAVTGATPGPGGFGPQAAIEFYGTGIDTPYSGERVYWLVAEGTPGQRIPQLPSSTGSNQPPASFPFTVELTPHTTYFSALITTDGQNFFGPLISNVAYEQAIDTPHFDPNSAAASQLEIVLQGVVLGFPHDVSISLNGTSLGELNFSGQQKGRFTANLPPGVLQAGSNTVTLTAQNGEYDTSLLQSMRITYPHLYAADSDLLKFTAHSGEQIQIAGFKTSAATVLDITDPRQPIQLSPVPAPDPTHAGRYTLQLQVPWAANASSAGHTLLALGSDRILAVAGLRRNHPSRWHQAQQGSEIVMISAAQFASALVPLVSAHEKQSQSSAVVPVDDLYDEFTFGEHNPWAIRAFLRGAGKNWRTPPHYLLLNGRASLDPRNYLGFGYLDFVPTRIVPTSQMMTASDDWFSDFNDTGFASIATGRFPVSTPAEAELIAGKVATYEGQSTNGAWTSQALMVADFNDTENFTQDSQLVQAQLPKSLNVTDVFASTMTSTQAAQEILDNINAGQILVNYSGHGSEDQWSGSDLFDNTTVASLTNGSSLPVFLIMDCLNGFFQDVYDQPLAVTLMLAENGGAVAVLASSSLNQPAPQTILDKLIAQQAFNSPYPALGDAILKAKSGITDIGVRKTYNLLGDPAMQIKPPATTK